MTHIFGGCLCEKVRYKITAQPISQGVCYCLQCQKTGGAFGSPMMVLHKQSFECPQQNLLFFETMSNRGSTVRRYFCRDCGSHVCALISDVEDLVTVKACTLRDFSFFVPEYLVFTKNAGPTCVLPAGVPSFQTCAPFEMVLGRK